MLTYEDCIGLANLDLDEVAEIAVHERLPYMSALGKGAALLMEPWGDAALRQMVWDNLCAANHYHRTVRAQELVQLYRDTCDRHPCLCDRRTSSIRQPPPIERTH